jgi:hypothetical protein
LNATSEADPCFEPPPKERNETKIAMTPIIIATYESVLFCIIYFICKLKI